MKSRHSAVRYIDPTSPEGKQSLAHARFGGFSRKPIALLPPESISDSFARRSHLYDLNKKFKFSAWLNLYLLIKGQYSITEKGMAEVYDPTDFAPETPKEKLTSVARASVDRMIDSGDLAKAVDQKWIAIAPNWNDAQTRREVLTALVSRHTGGIRTMMTTHLTEIGLEPLLRRYDSLYCAFVDIGMAHSFEDIAKHAESGGFDSSKIYPWELIRVPKRLWESTQTQCCAVKWLIWKKGGIDAKDLTTGDFDNHGLAALIKQRDSRHSVFGLLRKLGFVEDSDETYMKRDCILTRPGLVSCKPDSHGSASA